ncbi:MAG: hypothetical protein ACXU89_16900 [Xanthobacteraceae bacterium]
MSAFIVQPSCRGHRRTIEVAGFAQRRHAARKIEQRGARRELQGVVRRQMHVHVDKAGQGVTAVKPGSHGGRRVANSGNRAVGEFYRRAGAPILHRVDDGDAGDLEDTFGGTARRRRPPQYQIAEKIWAVKKTHGTISVYSSFYEYEYIFMLLTI